MENTMNNIINNEAVDATMEAVNEIDMAQVPDNVMPEANLGNVGKVLLWALGLTAIATAGVATYRWIKKKVTHSEPADIDPETAAQREADAIDYEVYAGENSDEE